MPETVANLPINQKSIELVQQSWKAVLPITDVAATLFYDRLFTLDPSLRKLFRGDFEEQKRKLMQTLNVAVEGLKRPKALVPILERLGVRHIGYLVEEKHYNLVGEALIWTLQEGLGEGFTPEVKESWRQVYGLISDVMKTAARQFIVSSSSSSSLSSVQGEQTQLSSSQNNRPFSSSSLPVPNPRSVLPVSKQSTELVQKSWKSILPISEAVSTLFYDRLFTLDPSLRKLFKNDTSEQKRKFMQTLNVTVEGLKRPQALLQALERLGIRHIGYLTESRHYKVFGEALLWAIQEGLGESLSPATQKAWQEVYDFIANVMKRSAAQFVSASSASIQKQQSGSANTKNDLQRPSPKSPFTASPSKRNESAKLPNVIISSSMPNMPPAASAAPVNFSEPSEDPTNPPGFSATETSFSNKPAMQSPQPPVSIQFPSSLSVSLDSRQSAPVQLHLSVDASTSSQLFSKNQNSWGQVAALLAFFGFFSAVGAGLGTVALLGQLQSSLGSVLGIATATLGLLASGFALGVFYKQPKS